MGSIMPCSFISAIIFQIAIAATNALAQDTAKWQRWVDLVIQTANDPALVDMAEHILYIGRKPL